LLLPWAIAKLPWGDVPVMGMAFQTKLLKKIVGMVNSIDKPNLSQIFLAIA
jgi:hypothetical protein